MLYIGIDARTGILNCALKDESESTRINLIPELDKLSKFLADIDSDCYYYNNWK